MANFIGYCLILLSIVVNLWITLPYYTEMPYLMSYYDYISPIWYKYLANASIFMLGMLMSELK